MLCQVMSLQKKPRVEKVDPGRVSIRKAVFESFWKNELGSGACQIDLGFISPFAPKTVEISAPSQTLRFIFSDGSLFESTPWDFLRKEETLPRNAIAGALIFKAVGAIW